MIIEKLSAVGQFNKLFARWTNLPAITEGGPCPQCNGARPRVIVNGREFLCHVCETKQQRISEDFKRDAASFREPQDAPHSYKDDQYK